MFFSSQLVVPLVASLVVVSMTQRAIADVPILLQDFESGLGSNESTTGNFAINSSNAPLNNGTLMMGHPTDYGSSDLSWYELDVDLTLFATATMTFDYRARFEQWNPPGLGPDGFVVRANPVNIAPPIDVITPTVTSDMQYTPHPFAVGNTTFYGNIGPLYYDSSSGSVEIGTAEFDLTALAGAPLTLRFLFDADNSIHSHGFNMDNLEIRGEFKNPAIPEPSSAAMLVLASLSLAVIRNWRRDEKS